MPKRHKKKVNVDADLEEELDQYEPSDSDDDIDREDKLVIESARKGDPDDSEEEVLGIHSSSEDEEDEDENDDKGESLGSDMDSDLEVENKGSDDGNVPDRKAWGKKTSRYYNTDYVDKDYGGLGKDEEEAALLEEEEADVIQRRLIAELEESDLTMGLLTKAEEKLEKSKKIEEDIVKEKIQMDFTKLSKEEKIEILKLESPEMFSLIEDIKKRVEYVKGKITKVLGLVEEGVIENCQLVQYLRLEQKVVLKYWTYISFYLYLKSMRVRVDDHMVVKRILQLRKVLEELDRIKKEVADKEVEKLLEIKDSQLEPVEKPHEDPPANRAERRKRKLKLLEDRKALEEEIEKKKRRLEGEGEEKEIVKFEESPSEEDEEEEDGDKETPGDEAKGGLEKRAISYQIAKNKGLTPRRKKEQRNPRVKHRNKYKKAKIRRKGQVREVRKELSKYSGEISGIKAFVSKSVKLK